MILTTRLPTGQRVKCKYDPTDLSAGFLALLVILEIFQGNQNSFA